MQRLEEPLCGRAPASLRARGTELPGCGGGVRRGQRGSECARARRCSGQQGGPGKVEMFHLKWFNCWHCDCSNFLQKQENNLQCLWLTERGEQSEPRALSEHNLVVTLKISEAQTQMCTEQTERGVPGIPAGRSTGRRLWAACCQVQLHTPLELEQGPGHDAGKPLCCRRGAAAGTQKPFPDPPDAASLWTHTRESCETWK